jgi:hypothetical protein
MPKQFVVKAHREPKRSLAYTPALRADIHTKCSIGRIGLSTAVRRALHERLVWDEPTFAAQRMNSHIADKPDLCSRG